MDSLQKTILRELTRMLARSLDNAPAADELPYYAEVMYQDITSAMQLDDDDCQRLTHAFNLYGRGATKWPVPRQIIEIINAYRYEFKKEVKQLPVSQEIKEGRKRAAEKGLRSMREVIGSIERVREVQKKAFQTINDEDHERLIHEKSIEGEVYRLIMGYPEPREVTVKRDENTEDLFKNGQT